MIIILGHNIIMCMPWVIELHGTQTSTCECLSNGIIEPYIWTWVQINLFCSNRNSKIMKLDSGIGKQLGVSPSP